MTSNMSTGDPDVGQASSEALDIILGPSEVDRASIIQRRLDLERVIGSREHFDPERIATQTGDAYDRCSTSPASRANCAPPRPRQSNGAAARRHHPDAGDARRRRQPDRHQRRRGTAQSIPGARFVVLQGMGHD